MTQALTETSATPAALVTGAPAHAVHNAIGLLAQRALQDELHCYPKPGLVSLVDNGSHTDMNADVFRLSLLALNDYFPAIAAAGADDAGFAQLQVLGKKAEHDMLRATQGVNTHRGAIFCLGLLAAAAGHRLARKEGVVGNRLGTTVQRHWGQALLADAPTHDTEPLSHGGSVQRRHGLGGARAEAAAGFPHVFNVGLPALQLALQQTGDRERARVQCFFSLMAVLPDTNLVYRAGPDGLVYAQEAAREFIAAGGVRQAAWRARARSLHGQFIQRRLSPGGSADLLAATLFVHGLQQWWGK